MAYKYAMEPQKILVQTKKSIMKATRLDYIIWVENKKEVIPIQF
jgi:hypothetical protein